MQVEQSYIAEDVIRDFEDHIEYAEAECITGMRQRGDSRRYQIGCVTLQPMCLPFLQAVHYSALPTAAALIQPAPHLHCNEAQLCCIVYQPLPYSAGGKTIIQKPGSQRRLSQTTLYGSGRNSSFSSRGQMALQSTATVPPVPSKRRLLLLHKRLLLAMLFRKLLKMYALAVPK